MKTLLTILFLLIASPAFAETLTFTWEANPSEEAITGYRLYMDSGENMVKEIADPTATTTTYEVTDKLNHAFSLTAYRVNEDGSVDESGHSDYAVFAYQKTPLPKPGKFKLVTK